MERPEGFLEDFGLFSNLRDGFFTVPSVVKSFGFGCSELGKAHTKRHAIVCQA
jgi:hypothetical protein